ncbi:hypothetical protein [Pseudoalteromonas sp. S558]|uniref:hypothetical protein n=1 Tax=Pseudoalteromonas sp. S558 TaxID=2066515 RepID=UPI00110B87FB|nr:hypothetical protein [Pseudoalteromonas sp. S558]TMO06179.1 hypothetical protein CWB66_05365 [Pseudoalteromonas sp. S558]
MNEAEKVREKNSSKKDLKIAFVLCAFGCISWRYRHWNGDCTSISNKILTLAFIVGYSPRNFFYLSNEKLF